MAEITWGQNADRYLEPLFRGGRTPTRQELIDAYPYGERQYWPYKAWLRRVRLWKQITAMGLRSPEVLLSRRRQGSRWERRDKETGDLFHIPDAL